MLKKYEVTELPTLVLIKLENGESEHLSRWSLNFIYFAMFKAIWGGGGGGGGGVWGQKCRAYLKELFTLDTTLYRIQKSLPVLQIFTLQVSKIVPFRGKNRP